MERKNEQYKKLIGKRYFGWEIIDIDLKKECALCLRIEENNFEDFKIGEKRVISIEYFILKFLNNQVSKRKILPEELLEFLK